ncbi:MAG: glycosyltransferase, partial [Solirubrobacterales bacterium]
MGGSTRLSVVVVTHNCRGAVGRSLPPLTAQLVDGDELIVVDNASVDGTPALVRELAPDATV